MPALMIAVIFPATNDQSKITRITVARGSSHEANHCAGRYGDVRDRRLCGHRIGDSQCRLTEVFIDPRPRLVRTRRDGLPPWERAAVAVEPFDPTESAFASCRKRRRTTGSDMARYAANNSAASRRRSLEAQLAWMHRVHPQRRTRQARPAPYLNHKGGRR